MEAAQLVDPGLTLDELAAQTPRSRFRPKPLLRVILTSEVAAGGIIETNGGFALNPERWPADQIAALRELK